MLGTGRGEMGLPFFVSFFFSLYLSLSLADLCCVAAHGMACWLILAVRLWWWTAPPGISRGHLPWVTRMGVPRCTS